MSELKDGEEILAESLMDSFHSPMQRSLQEEVEGIEYDSYYNRDTELRLEVLEER